MGTTSRSLGCHDYVYFLKTPKRTSFFQKCSPGSKADFSEKCLSGIWKWILRRYDIEWHDYDIISIIQYTKGHIKNRYWISHLLKSIISNFLLEYVAFLMKYVILCFVIASSWGAKDPAAKAPQASGAWSLQAQIAWKLAKPMEINGNKKG